MGLGVPFALVPFGFNSPIKFTIIIIIIIIFVLYTLNPIIIQYINFHSHISYPLIINLTRFCGVSPFSTFCVNIPNSLQQNLIRRGLVVVL